MNARIVVVPPSAETGEIARELAPAGFELTLVQPESPQFAAALGDAAYMVCYPSVKMADAFYRAAPRLRLVQLLAAGYDNVDLAAARRAKVPVANNGGANAISVSEHAMMLMLTVARRVIWQHGNVSAGRWRGNGPSPRMYELFGKTIGIVGLGTIGKKVARLARAFGMRVEYYDIARLSEDAEDALGVRFRLLNELLSNADVVSLHVPLNEFDPPHDWAARTRPNEADRAPDQHQPRARGRGGRARSCAQRGPVIRRRPRRFRS